MLSSYGCLWTPSFSSHQVRKPNIDLFSLTLTMLLSVSHTSTSIPFLVWHQMTWESIDSGRNKERKKMSLLNHRFPPLSSLDQSIIYMCTGMCNVFVYVQTYTYTHIIHIQGIRFIILLYNPYSYPYFPNKKNRKELT